MEGNIWLSHAQDCIKKYKGKMLRFHLKHGGSIDGILTSQWKHKYTLATCINQQMMMVSVSYRQIKYVDVLSSLSLDGEKHICSFIYKSKN